MFARHLSAAITRRPAVPVAVLFIVGIALHSVLPASPIALLLTMALLLIAAIVLRSRGGACSALLAGAIVVAGLCSGRLAVSYFSADDIGAFAASEPRLAWVEGVVVDTPRFTAPPTEGRKLPEKQVSELDVKRVCTRSGWVRAVGRMPLTISPAATDLAAGQKVRALGMIERPPEAMNPGGFDAAAHYRRQRILVSMHVSRPYDIEVLSVPTRAGSLLSGFRERSRHLLSDGFDASHATDRALLAALVFGDREPVLRPVSDDFTHTGTTHLLASNGARIALLAGLAYLLCRLLRFTPRKQVVFATVAVSIFGFLTMPGAEAIRPVIVCAAIGLGLIRGSTLDSLQVLSIAAIAILAPRPMDLYGAGFQLSFVIVCGMILFTRPAMRFLERFENKDRKVAESFQKPTRWRLARRWARDKLLTMTVAGAVAWLIAVPLVAYHFEQFNPWTIPLGVILTPEALLALAGGFAKIILTAACPSLAVTWAHLAGACAAALRHAVHLMAFIPGSDLPIARPAVWQLFVFYAALCLQLVQWPRWQVRWCARCAPVGACTLLLILPLCGGAVGITPVAGRATALKVTLLSLGAGQCAVIEPAGGGIVIFDAGSSSVADPARNVIEPFLRHEQCRTIDAIWLSHGDFDHISAARELVAGYGVRDVLTSPHLLRHAHESKPCEALLRGLSAAHHPPHLVTAGDRINIGPGDEVEVLWPPAHCDMNSNNTGLVLRLTCGGRSILFPADIQEPAERELLKHPEKLRSDVLIAPHHGSSETTTAAFIRAVDAQYILASNDSRLTMKQRVFDAETAGRPTYRTSRYGAITLDIARDGSLKLTPFHTPAPPLP